jgi:hypothetical protein
MRASTHRPAEHECLARLAQRTVCKILGQEEMKPHKVRYYLERRDAEFERKMAAVLCVYREVQVLKKVAASKSNKSDRWRLSPTMKSRVSGHRHDGAGFAARARRARDLHARS